MLKPSTEHPVVTTSVVPKAAEAATTNIAASTRPEIELLLCCARTHIDPATAKRIKTLLQTDIDWTYLLRTARRHGVMPLLYWSLHTTYPETVPQATLAQLRDHFQTNTRRNIFLTKELLRLLNLFEAHGVPAVPLKGPVLAVSVYGDSSLRQFTDLDILVHPQDVSKARNLLISQGYRAWRYHQQTSAQKTASLQVQYESNFVSDDGKVGVELHWSLIDRQDSFPLDLSRLWERLEPVSLAGMMVPNFSPEDLLLFLCVHGAKPWHRWGRLGWLCDVAELIRAQQGLDWEWVMAQAGQLGSERRLWLGLRLASDLLGTALPETVRSRMQADPIVKSLAAQVCERLFDETDHPAKSSDRFRFHLKTMERRPDRVRTRFYRVLTRTVIKWAIRPPIGLLSVPYHLLDRTRCRNVWLWPLPLFAILSYCYHLLLPVRRVAKYGLHRKKN